MHDGIEVWFEVVISRKYDTNIVFTQTSCLCQHHTCVISHLHTRLLSYLFTIIHACYYDCVLFCLPTVIIAYHSTCILTCLRITNQQKCARADVLTTALYEQKLTGRVFGGRKKPFTCFSRRILYLRTIMLAYYHTLIPD